MSLVDPARPDLVVTPPTTSRTTVVVSLAAHVLVVVAVLVVPLFARVRLPAPSARIGAFVLAAAVPEIPAPPAPAAPGAPDSTTARAATPAPVTTRDTPTAAPVVAPKGMPPGEPPPLASGGSLDGVPGALVGGGTPGLGSPPPPPPPVPVPVPRPMRVGGDIRPPRKLRHVAPVYPPIAAQARVTGTVMLEATISPAGEIVDVHVLRSVPLLDQAAIEAVRQWRYDPPLLNGAPVSVLLTVSLHFSQ